MKRVILMIDGGFLRSACRADRRDYDPSFVHRFALSCLGPDEEFLRILYYDCVPYNGTVIQPISGTPYQFTGSDHWLHEVAALDLFAVRTGVLKFRGFERIRPMNTGPLTDDDFRPKFEQKGVDMRIGLDIAAYSDQRLVERVLLITNDTDCVPAMKYARIAGLQTVLIQVPNRRPSPELVAHSDFKRLVAWPEPYLVSA